jgi:hypothetical protein
MTLAAPIISGCATIGAAYASDAITARKHRTAIFAEKFIA